MQQKLTRSSNAWIGGICGGIAEHFGWSPGATRFAYVLLSALSAAFPGILAYLILWMLMPPPPRGFRLEDFREQ